MAGRLSTERRLPFGALSNTKVCPGDIVTLVREKEMSVKPDSFREDQDPFG